jgi:hypothetical protein
VLKINAGPYERPAERTQMTITTSDCTRCNGAIKGKRHAQSLGLAGLEIDFIRCTAP